MLGEAGHCKLTTVYKENFELCFHTDSSAFELVLTKCLYLAMEYLYFSLRLLDIVKAYRQL